MSEYNFEQPKDVSQVDMVFGQIDGLMPKYSTIEEYDRRDGWGHKLFTDWFYCGLKSLEMKPKEGIDKEKALRHIKAIMGSFEPKHEHKTAACAYLFEKWFESAKWERKEFRQ